jgi:hypothetical protein
MLAAAAALSLGLAGQARAGGCCAVTEEIYALPLPLPDPVPAVGSYPYVGYVYSGYPYGLQNSGGYPRGFYSPFTGYPYADPPPYVYRAYHGSVRSVRRHPRYR